MKTKRFWIIVLLALLVSCAPAAEIVSQAAQQDYIESTLNTKTAGSSPFVALGFLVVIGIAIWAISGLEIKNKKLLIYLTIIVCSVMSLMIGSFISIDQGEVGVLVRMGKAIEVRNPGLNTVIPYVDRIVLFSTRDWTYATMLNPSSGNEDYRDFPTTLITQNGAQASLTYTIQGRLVPEQALTVYERYGTLANAISQSVKFPARVITRQKAQEFDAKKLYLEVDNVDSSVTEELEIIMRQGGLELIMFGFRKPQLGINGDLEISLNNALVAQENAKVAEQEIAVKEAEAKQSVATAEGQKQVAIKQAEAKAASILVEAEAQAEANKILANSISGSLIDYIKWSNWDGKLPLYTSDLGNFLISVP
jgi:regulator of protease activity HflC (stomatin/prohibitin superfamily)